MDLTGIRKAIAANAATAAGLVDSKHYDPGVSQASPAFWVVPLAIRRASFKSLHAVTLEGTLQFLGTWDRSKQEAADTLAMLVWAGIESDDTLGGLASSIKVEEAVWDAVVPDSESVTITYEIEVHACVT